MIKQEIYAALKKLIETIEHDRGNAQAEIDTLTILLEGNEALFGKLFVKLVDEFRVGYTHDLEYGPERLAVNVNRLKTVHDTYARKETIQVKPELENDELTPVFSLNKQEKTRVSKLCADLRNIVTASTSFDQAHKVRLLNRICAVETEVQKDKGRFDVVTGMVSDVGETLGKFGVDIKPLTDRVTEIAGIARKNTKAYDQLAAPEEQKRLPAPEDEE